MSAALGLLVLAVACTSGTPAEPTETVTPKATAIEAAPSAPPVATAAATIPATAVPPSPTPLSRALRDIGGQEVLLKLAELPVPRSGFGVRMAFSPNQPVLYHTGVGLEIQGFDFQAGELVFQLRAFERGAPLVLALSPQGDRLVAEDGPMLSIWDLPTGGLINRIEMPAPFTPLNAKFVGLQAFFADDEAGNLALWETTGWRETARLRYPGLSDGSFVLPGADGVVMLIRGQEELSLWDWSGQMLNSFPIKADPWRLLAISPQGDRALLHLDIGQGSEGYLVLSLDAGAELVRIPLLNIRASAISSDWRTLAAVDGSEVLHLFDPESGQEFHRQQLPAFQVNELALSPDGVLLAVYLRRADSAGGWIEIWGRDQP